MTRSVPSTLVAYICCHSSTSRLRDRLEPEGPAGVVDEHVHAVAGGRRQPGDVVVARDVARHGHPADLRGEGLDPLDPPGSAHDAEALRRQQPCRRGADAAARTGDDGVVGGGGVRCGGGRGCWWGRRSWRGPWVGWWWGRRRSRWPRRAPAARRPARTGPSRSGACGPRPPRCHARMTCGSPTAGRASTRAVIVPSTIGRPAMPADQPPGQSSAAHTSGRSASRGAQVAAYRPVPSSSGPGRRQRASAGSRPVPHAKQVGERVVGQALEARLRGAVAARARPAVARHPRARGRRGGWRRGGRRRAGARVALPSAGRGLAPGRAGGRAGGGAARRTVTAGGAGGRHVRRRGRR